MDALQTVSVPAGKRLHQQCEEVLPLIDRVIYQTERRVLYDEKLCAAEKLVSLFEPHTQIIKRQKAGKAVEFGHKLWLEEVEGGIVSGYRVLEEAGQDDRYVAQSLTDHRHRFGHPPWLVAGDRGVSSPTNEHLARNAGVKRVVLPAKGKVSGKRKQQERERWFRRGFRFRPGIEGRISVLRRCYELDRCRDHGDEGMGRWIWLGDHHGRPGHDCPGGGEARGDKPRREWPDEVPSTGSDRGSRARRDYGAKCHIVLADMRCLAILRQKLVLGALFETY